MIGYFPDFYPDELLYSVLARYHAGSGYLGYITTAEDLFNSPWSIPDIEFLNTYTEQTSNYSYMYYYSILYFNWINIRYFFFLAK